MANTLFHSNTSRRIPYWRNLPPLVPRYITVEEMLSPFRPKKFTGSNSKNSYQFLNAYKGIERNVTKGCMNDTHMVLSNILTTSVGWQKKLLDASGKPPAGILQGAVHWAGDYESCLKIKSPFGPGNLSEHNPLIHGQYCSVQIDFPKEGFIKKIPVALLPIFGPQLNGMSVIWDICTTQRCSAPELKTLFTPAFNLLNRFASVNLTSVVCKKPPNLLKHNEAIGALGFFSVYFLLLLVGTIYDICFNKDNSAEFDLQTKVSLAFNNFSFSPSEFPVSTAFSKKEESKHAMEMSNGLQRYSRKSTSIGGAELTAAAAVGEISAATSSSSIAKDDESLEKASTSQANKKVVAPVMPPPQPPSPTLPPPPPLEDPSLSENERHALSNIYNDIASPAQTDYLDERKSSETYEILDAKEVNQSTSHYDTAMPSEVSFDRQNSEIKEILGSFLLAFSLKRNANKILTCTHSVEMLSSLNGIRFLSMVWIILAHTYLLGMNDEIKNPMSAIPIAQRFTFQAVFSATFAADTFFLLSGTLLTYSFIDNFYSRGENGLKHIFKIYLTRFLRLTPYYAIILIFVTCLMPYMFQGPFNDLSIETACREKWWSNLIYLNNMYKIEEMCMSWTWYLANDVQFYSVAPIILSLITALPSVGLLVVTFLLCAYIAATTVLWQKLLTGTSITFDDVYTKPWTRMSPFLIGILLGYFLRMKHRKRSISKLYLSFGWFITLAISMVICYIKYTMYKTDDPIVWTNAQTTSYELLSRPIWALLVSWVIVICASGNGGIVTSILSYSAFIPLDRLTYGAFLLHPIIMTIAKRLNMVTIYLSTPTVMYTFIGHLVITYGVSFITTIMFDSPVRMITKVFNRK
ncbi:nose resistant to fluoxetine protein 6-like isoform X2 [Octopus sinensis]|uniref:Nose resistant to fluoxetine protein 6-like isoform X2 n=1 Tax=Octopus sinensis TaxID=2607531 RepID=A0A7E6FP07_9MOLL|nr:nose resistant to fluoxetine protein 6-like isoform X2 [Octopus sinensis]XP_036369384.1 nose resistant to fluoxetine protein 6-like isoform X2 [Octopus sinensis]XP_036369385.1 nose resistant to fluoxetine protein 6-like isoform X2 [Octopus sinensis]